MVRGQLISEGREERAGRARGRGCCHRDSGLGGDGARRLKLVTERASCAPAGGLDLADSLRDAVYGGGGLDGEQHTHSPSQEGQGHRIQLPA